MRRVLSIYSTTIGRKWAMAISGLMLVGFTIGHMLGNLKIFVDRGGHPAHGDAFALDQYGDFLRHLGYPALPEEGFLWIARLGLIAAVAIHIHAAVTLKRRARAARGVGYKKENHDASSYASRSMIVGGILILAFIIFHILHFTTGQAHHDFQPHMVHANVTNAFSIWWMAGLYVVANIFLGLHLWHGVWSAFQTLGLDNAKYNHWRRRLAWGTALLVAGGNILIPVAVLAGIVQLPS